MTFTTIYSIAEVNTIQFKYTTEMTGFDIINIRSKRLK